MNVYKFGGASVKDATSVKNVAHILKNFAAGNTIVVISAMGKVTNALEKLVDAVFYKNEAAGPILEEIKKYHFDIVKQLFPTPQHPIYNELNNTFVELDWAIEDELTGNYDYEYDKIVCMGEIISTKIVNAYLNEIGIPSKWWDARDVIQTDNSYRE
ncbi:MAG TPA: aspartate kinase, partial [Bacteroidia bacterium]|nr:aspartate kinase [Bacteroidia bacterium]